MYATLLILHSLWRWAVVISLLTTIVMAYRGRSGKVPFTPAANNWRHWTATILHLQMLLGMALYVQSPVLTVHMASHPGKLLSEPVFFRYLHLGMMLLATVLVTIGSAKAKRMQGDEAKYQTMLTWFSLGLAVIIIAIPWPFSPLSGRPLYRTF
ncbi:hypothetical protein C7T94_02225 [Pedobacter yulinensis]|uniref:Cytochrome B n=1 Tax=Pedobacter yulinensis TaxID=2126353 RepID=A0A2T3HSC9_9SPHI|nr:hypothetical protein [Pedobacter yulinensis]PST85287.1 hypothetical protein C7T94_02225 [Pedobacter yulinensis]